MADTAKKHLLMQRLHMADRSVVSTVVPMVFEDEQTALKARDAALAKLHENQMIGHTLGMFLVAGVSFDVAEVEVSGAPSIITGVPMPKGGLRIN